MANADDLRNLLMEAVNELTNRGMKINEPDEQQSIEQQIRALNRRIQRLDQMLLLEAAAAVSNAADALADVVRLARTGPFDDYVVNMKKLIDGMRIAQEQIMSEQLAVERDFPKTEEAAEENVPQPQAPERPAAGTARGLPAQPTAQPAASEPGATAAPKAAPAGRPSPPDVVNSTKFPDLKPEYDAAWACCEVRREKRNEIDAGIAKARANKARYEAVAAHFHGMPWQFLAVIHGMECGFRFDRHLHNGDPLTGRTVRVPPGRPTTGNPPFTWEDSARDAMEHMGYDKVTDWSLPHVLYLLERYNGFGYRFKGLRTPYLWSYSNLYEKGRYVADRVFDPNAVSKQCGAAILLKELL